MAAGIGEPQTVPPIYDQRAEEIVLGAVLDGQVTVESLAPFVADHCCVLWVATALRFSGTTEERCTLMAESGWPNVAVEQVRHCAQYSPVICMDHVRAAAGRVTENYKRRALARACRRVACEMEADAVSYEEAVATLRATIMGLR